MRTDPVGRGPAPLSRGVSAAAGLLGVLTAGAYSLAAGAVAAGGLVVLAGGLAVGARRAVTVGGLGLLVGVLVAGVQAAPAAALLVGVAATALAWDAGGYAIDLGAQLGREAATRRVEVVHLAGSAAVAVAAAGVGYGVYHTAGEGQPVAALLLLLLAGVVLLAALERT